LKIESENYFRKVERATGIEPVLPAWESKLSTLYFQHLQNRSAETYVHALHTVHALPDLRIAAGRFAGRFRSRAAFQHHRSEVYFFAPEASRYSRSMIIHDKKLSPFLGLVRNTINLTHEMFRNDVHKSVPRKIKTATPK
jgi:hypothetical protein